MTAMNRLFPLFLLCCDVAGDSAPPQTCDGNGCRSTPSDFDVSKDYLWKKPAVTTLVIETTHGEIRIVDGVVTLPPGLKPDRAALEFWEAMAKTYKEACLPCVKEPTR